MMESKRKGLLLWQKLLVLLAVAIIVLAVGLGYATWRSLGQASRQIELDGRDILSRQTETFLAKLVGGQVDTVDLQFAQAQTAAAYGATLVTEQLVDGAFDPAQLAEDAWPILLERANNSTTIYYVSTAGVLYIYPQPDGLPANFNILGKEFFTTSLPSEVRPGEVWWNEVHEDPFSREYDLVVDAIAPVVVNEELRGYVGVSVSLSQLIAQFNQRQPIRGSYSFLMDASRQLVAAPPLARTDLLPPDQASVRGVADLNITGNSDLDTVLQNMVLGQAAVEQVAIKDELKYVAYQPLNNINWRLGTVVPVPLATAASTQLVEVVESGSGQALRGMLLWTTGLLLVALIGGAVLVRRFLTPLQHMVTATETIAAGDLDSRVAVTSRDEIGHLAIAFNKMTDQLRQLIGSLEDQVHERTAELSLSMEVGQKAVAIRSLEELLPTITEFIRDKFDLYYTHVYSVDDIGENLVIQAGTGDVGRELLAQRHSLPIGPGSIVGRVAASGEPVLVSDTETSDVHKPNPLLPDTRSELAVPLIVEGQVIGVLDMQSERVNTFTEENLTVFEAMATQLAISIDSARQWSAAQEAQRKSEEAVRQLSRESWAEKLAREKRELGYIYDLSTVKPISESNGETAGGGVSAPLVVQNQPIGRLAVNKPPNRPWTSDEQELLSAVAQQLAQKAESLRLFEQSQERATREQIARQITDKIRASRDIEAALKTAAEELSKALSTSKAVVDLKVSETEQNGHGDS